MGVRWARGNSGSAERMAPSWPVDVWHRARVSRLRRRFVSGLALQIGFLRMSGRMLDAVRTVPPTLWRHHGEHRPIDQLVQPNSRDSSLAWRPACTSPTICRRNSGVYRTPAFGFDLPITDPPLVQFEESTKAGQLPALEARPGSRFSDTPKTVCGASTSFAASH